MKQDLLLCDIVISTGRRTLVVFLASAIAHSGIMDVSNYSILLFLVAVFMFFGEMLTFSLQVAAAIREPFFNLIDFYLRGISPAEIVQYLIGILGALAAMQGYWALLLLALPTFLAYTAFKSANEMRDSTQQILEGMADTVDLRDPYTGGHSRRVADIAKRILKELNTPGPEADQGGHRDHNNCGQPSHDHEENRRYWICGLGRHEHGLRGYTTFPFP